MRVPHVDFGNITKVSGLGSPYQTAKGATPDAFGAGIGRAMAGLGQATSKAADDTFKIASAIQQEDNEGEARELDAEFMNAITIESHGGQLDPNNPQSAKTGFYNTKNKDTSAALSDFNNAINEHRERIYGKASNDAVKRIIEKQFSDRVFSQFNQSHKYAAQQKSNYRKIQAQSRQSASMNLGINGTETDFIQAFYTIENDERALSKGQGLEKAIVDQRIAQKRSDLIIGRISRLNASDEPGASKKAKALFESQSALGNIDGKRHGALKEAIDKANVGEETNRVYDEWIQANPMETSVGDLNPDNVRAARKKAATIKDDTVRKAFEAKIDKDVSRINAVAKAEKSKIASEVRTWLHENPGKDIFDWKALENNGPKFTRIAGDGTLFKSIVSTQTAIQKGEQFAAVTDNKTFSETLRIPKTELAKVEDARSEIPNWQKMTEGEQNKILTKIQNDKKEIIKLKQNPRYLRNTWVKLSNNMPKKMAKAMSDPDLPATDPNFEIVMSAREVMRTWMLDDRQINNPPNDEAIQRKAAEIMMDIRSDPEGFESDERSFTGYAVQRNKMSAKQRAVATVPINEIPDYIRKAIEADINARRGTRDPNGRVQALWVETRNRINDEGIDGVIEELAGAIAMNDRRRIDRILGRSE